VRTMSELLDQWVLVDEQRAADETHGLRDDPAFGEDDLANYELAVTKYGDYVKAGSQALIKSLQRKVTSIEARVYAERSSVKRHSGWQNELEMARARGENIYKDDFDACLDEFRQDGDKFDASYGEWYKEISGQDGCTNPTYLLQRAMDQMIYWHDEKEQRGPLELQAFIADLFDAAKTLEDKQRAEEARCKGVYIIVIGSKEPHLMWRNRRTKQSHHVAPTTEMINRERAKRAAEPAADDDDRSSKRYRLSDTRSGFAGGGAMPFIVGSKRAVAKDVKTKRPAPTDRQEPTRGMVPYRTDAVEHNPIGERECVIEALRAALGTNRLTRAFLGLPLKGDLIFKEAVQAVREKTAFEFVKSPPVRWSGLITKPQGIYIGRALLKDGEAHYMVYDAWRHLIFVGGAPPPAAKDQIEHLLLEDAPAPSPYDNVGRSWFVEEHELLDPPKFQEYMRKTLKVERGIDQLYRVEMNVKHARKTEYNTPEHYD